MESKIKLENQEYKVSLEKKDGNIYTLTINDLEKKDVKIIKNYEGIYSVLIDNKSYEISLNSLPDEITAYLNGKNYKIAPLVTKSKKISLNQEIIYAPMAGKIVKIISKEGDNIKEGETLFIMEAMKMESEIKNPINGKLKQLLVKVGESVEAKTKLAIIEKE